MSIALLLAWEPRGELPRFLRYRSRLSDIYSAIIIAAPHKLDAEMARALQAEPDVILVLPPEGTWRRFATLETALATDATHYHYIDMDRAVRWVETRPDELAETARRVAMTDCLLIGRTEVAWATHPQAMRQTEALFNTVFSHLLDLEADFGAGSRGFSRGAAQHIVSHCDPSHWADAAWPALLHRAGFALGAVTVDGLDWETPDQYRDTAADADTQRQVAQAYDADPAKWAFRVRVADEITRAGLAALG